VELVLDDRESASRRRDDRRRREIVDAFDVEHRR
jgi:hypothetical protein